MGKHKKQRTSRKSKGKRRACRANQERRKLESKKRRWTRYASEVAGGERSGSPARWDTTGLDRRLNQLREIIKKGSGTR